MSTRRPSTTLAASTKPDGTGPCACAEDAISSSKASALRVDAVMEVPVEARFANLRGSLHHRFGPQQYLANNPFAAHFRGRICDESHKNGRSVHRGGLRVSSATRRMT